MVKEEKKGKRENETNGPICHTCKYSTVQYTHRHGAAVRRSHPEGSPKVRPDLPYLQPPPVPDWMKAHLPHRSDIHFHRHDQSRRRSLKVWNGKCIKANVWRVFIGHDCNSNRPCDRRGPLQLGNDELLAQRGGEGGTSHQFFICTKESLHVCAGRFQLPLCLCTRIRLFPITNTWNQAQQRRFWLTGPWLKSAPTTETIAWNCIYKHYSAHGIIAQMEMNPTI